jgi:hypothetical protein
MLDSSITNSYTARGSMLLTQAKTYLKENKWDFVATSHVTHLFKQTVADSSFPRYLIKSTINKPMDQVVDLIWKNNEAGAKKNDPSIIDWRVVESGENYRICSQHNEMKWPIWNRHIVFAQHIFVEKEATYVVAFSVDHPGVDDETDTVRGKLNMSVYEFLPVSANTTTVRLVVHFDPCGTIPAYIVNLFTGNMVEKFNKWNSN